VEFQPFSSASFYLFIVFSFSPSPALNKKKKKKKKKKTIAFSLVQLFDFDRKE
jgi:hypothetical protein